MLEIKLTNFVKIFLELMGDYIKATLTAENNESEIYIPVQQIVYLEADERHSQTFIYCVHKEFKVKESIAEIISQKIGNK